MPDTGPQSLLDVARYFLDTRDDLLEDEEELSDPMAPDEVMEIVRREYVSGTCQAFAVALHDHLGWPIARVAQGMHMAVQRPDGHLVDFMGTFTVRDLHRRYGVVPGEPVLISRDEAMDAFVFEPHEDHEADPWSELNLARWVRQHLDRWHPDSPLTTPRRRRVGSP